MAATGVRPNFIAGLVGIEATQRFLKARSRRSTTGADESLRTGAWAAFRELQSFTLAALISILANRSPGAPPALTDDEVRALNSLASGSRIPAIALEMKRTEQAVRTLLYNVGVKANFKWGRYTPMVAEQCIRQCQMLRLL